MPRYPFRIPVFACTLALLLAAAAQAEVVVFPRVWEMPDDDPLELQVFVDGRAGVPCRWEAVCMDGTVLPMTDNRFVPPTLPGYPMGFTLRAIPEGLPEDQAGIAQVVVWPRLLHMLMEKCGYRSGDLLLERDPGFLDLGGGLPDHKALRGGRIPNRRLAQLQRIPWGLPWVLPLPTLDPSELGRMLTCNLSPWQGVVRADVSGNPSCSVVPSCPELTFRLETLSTDLPPDAEPESKDRAPRRLKRFIRTYPVECRGAHRVPLPFRPEDLGAVAMVSVGLSKGKVLVTDVGAHVVRMLDEQGRELHCWGQPGTTGTGPDGKPLFHSPRHAVWGDETEDPVAGQPLNAYVSDAANHAVYEVATDGSARLLAGVPGMRGHRDGPAHEALFDDPRGLVVMGDIVLVADRGNCVIRWIKDGEVKTLFGRPGVRVSQDGFQSIATFTDLGDMALVDGPQGQPLLLVLDGHTVRCVDLTEDRVTTVLGLAGEAGWQDNYLGGWADPEVSLTGPCLRNPSSITALAGGKQAAIVDQDGRALRIYDHHQGRLRTVVGNPARMPPVESKDQAAATDGTALAAFRPGALSDGVPLSQADHAELGEIRGVAGGEGGSVYVALRRDVAILQNTGLPVSERPTLQPSAARARVGEPFQVDCPLPRQEWVALALEARPVRTWIQCFDGDGRPLTEPVPGTARQGETVCASMTFATAGGKGAVVFQWTTDEGCSWSLTHPVEVLPADAPTSTTTQSFPFARSPLAPLTDAERAELQGRLADTDQKEEKKR